MSVLTGAPTLARLALRRDRVRIPVWIGSIVALVVVSAASIRGLYPTPAALAAAAAVVENNPTALVMNGPAQGLHTLGGRIAFEVGAFGGVVVALMNIFLVGRHTRAEEESGRTELVRAAITGRHAPLAAALGVATAADVLLAAAIAGGLVALGLPVVGALTLGAGLGAVGLVFAAVTALTAQVTEYTRGAYGLAITVLGSAFVLRAAGDVGDGTLSWFSPIGWAQAARPFAGERAWPLLLALGAIVLLVTVAVVLGGRRDVGAGLVRPQPGPGFASADLLRPLGLAARLQRGSLAAWSAAVFLVGIAYGSIAPDIGELVAGSGDMAEFFGPAGAGVTDAFLGVALLILALIGSGYAVQAALRPRTEEAAGRAEPLLATALSRSRWAGAHFAVALLGSAVVLAAGGLGTSLGYAVAGGGSGQVLRLLGAALVHAPAVWVLVGVVAALFGVVPRAAAAGWALLGGCFVVAMLGPLLGLPGWVSGMSPFQHVPQLPAAELAAAPLVALAAVACLLLVTGLAGLRRRDIG